MLKIKRTNAIIYCKKWPEMINFYRSILQLPVHFESEWFVEFQVCQNSFLSVADEKRATIKSAQGEGITFTWQVENIDQSHNFLTQNNIAVSPIKKKWDAHVCYFSDPEGNRIELWQPIE